MIYNNLNFTDKFYIKSRQKLIKKIEQTFRMSYEYKQWVSRQFNLYNLQCPFTGVDGYTSRKLLELHHHPFTLYEICEMQLDKFENEIGVIDEDIDIEFISSSSIEYFDLNRISTFEVQKFVQEAHLLGLVQYVPLTKTFHEQVHEIKDNYFQLDNDKYKIQDEWVYNLDKQPDLLKFLKYTGGNEIHNT